MSALETEPKARRATETVDVWLSRAVKAVAILLALSLLGTAGYWYLQRYTHESISVVDRDAQSIEAEIRQRPDDPQLRVAAANLYIEKGRLDDAISQADQLLKMSPDNLGALLALGRAYSAKGMLDAASGYLGRIVQLNADNPMAKSSLQLAQVHQELGNIYMKQGRAQDAAGEYRLALEGDRTNADTLRSLGNALVAQGQIDEGVKSLREALRFVPDFPEAYGDLYRAYEQNGDRALADYAFGMVRYSTGEYDQALESLKRAAGSLPDMSEVHLGLAMVYEKKGQRTEARDEYQKAAALDPNSIAAKQGALRLGSR